MTRYWLLPALLIVCLAGCNGGTESTVSNGPAPSEAGATATSTPTVGSGPNSIPPAPSSHPSIAVPQKPAPAVHENKTGQAGKQVGKTSAVKNPALAKQIREFIKEDEADRNQAIVVPPKGAKDWAPTKISPDYIAEHMDETIANMRNVSGEISAVIKEGDSSGRANLKLRVLNPKMYKVEFFEFGALPETCEVVSNGRYKMMRVGPKWKSEQPVDALLTLPDVGEPKNIQAVNLSPLVFQPLLKTNETWTGMVNRWLAPNSGYNLSVEFRSLLVGSGHVDQVRLYAERTPGVAKKLGKSTTEVVVDCLHSLPVTIISSCTPPNGKTWGIQWACSYHGVKSFEKDAFQAPFSSKVAMHGKGRVSHSTRL